MAEPLFTLMMLSFAAGVAVGWVWNNIRWHADIRAMGDLKG